MCPRRLVVPVAFLVFLAAFTLTLSAAPRPRRSTPTPPPATPPATAPQPATPANIFAPNKSTATPPAATQPAHAYEYHRPEILGTSLDMVIVAPAQSDADLAANAAIDEIERLRKILSTYDPAAELAKINAAPAGAPPVKASPELVEVLVLYGQWQEASHGAYNGHLGDLIALYKKAETADRLPLPEDLAPLVKQLAKPGWAVSDALKTVQRTQPGQINVDSLRKGYIIAKAVDAARQKAPTVAGLRLDLGGAIRVVGSSSLAESKPWRISVADPAKPTDNPTDSTPPLVTLQLRDVAVATSAPLARCYTIKGQKYAHLFDPRTGQPAAAAKSATVIAKDNTTANALATICCILPTTEALDLVQATPDAHAMIITPGGTPRYSEGFLKFTVPADSKSPAAKSLASPL